MKIGYARVSTLEQNLDRQIDQLKAEGCERIFCDKMSGKIKDRPELVRMMDMLRAGDVVVVSELSRLSRSLRDLRDTVDRLHELQVDLRSLKEPWADTTTPQGKLMFTIFGGISEFERDLIAQRSKEGVAAARSRGRFGGRPKKSDEDIRMAKTLYEAKYSLDEIFKRTGVSKSTLYKYMKI